MKHNPMMILTRVFLFSLLTAPLHVSSFIPNLHSSANHKTFSSTSILYANNPNRYDKEIEEKASINARVKSLNNNGVGSAAAGAILGGLMGGPFGAMFGASIGNQLGANTAFDKARKDEMQDMGISQQMLDQAKEMGVLLERGMEGLSATEDSLRTQQNFAKRLEQDMARIYSQATAALQDGNEDTAKDLLFKRTQIGEKLKKALMNCVDEKKRLTQMEDNVRAIEERALEMESLLKRSMGAKTLMDTSTASGNGTGFSLAPEDPLLQKFKDAGIG
jgi:hypothetical protein